MLKVDTLEDTLRKIKAIPQSILHIGCGTGEEIFNHIEPDKSYIGIEANPKRYIDAMIKTKEFSQHAKNISFMNCDGLSLPKGFQDTFNQIDLFYPDKELMRQLAINPTISDCFYGLLKQEGRVNIVFQPQNELAIGIYKSGGMEIYLTVRKNLEKGKFTICGPVFLKNHIDTRMGAYYRAINAEPSIKVILEK